MTRDPDILVARTDLRPVFQAMRQAKRQKQTDEVRSNLARLAAVTDVFCDAQSRIAVRAERCAISKDANVAADAMTAILSIDANEKERRRRWPTVAQLESAVRRERLASAARVDAAEQRHREAVEELEKARRAAAAAQAACIALTGYVN